MPNSLVVNICIIIGILVIRYIIKMAKAKPTTNPPIQPPKGFPNPNMKQPPPYIPQNQSNPFQQTPPQFSNPFQQIPTKQNPSTEQGDIDNLFGTKPDAFSQPSTGNTNSNMGVGSHSYYCMYCGKKFQSTEALLRDTCFKHPKADISLQKHVLYRGAGKPNIGF